MQIYKLILILIISISFLSCGKKCKDCESIPFDNGTLFIIKKNNIKVPDSVLFHTTIFYYDANGDIITKPENSCIFNSNAVLDNSSFMGLAEDSEGETEFTNSSICGFYFLAPIVSSCHQEGIFYIKYPDGDIDTLKIQSETVSTEQGKTEDCYCTNPIREIKFNGVVSLPDTSIHLSNGRKVYLFNK